jgi:hypothetical protein
MRFAWLRENEYSGRVFASSGSGKALLVFYNVIWWAPLVLPFTGVISYYEGFVAFFAMTVLRAIVNAYRVNVLSPERAIVFPLRQP